VDIAWIASLMRSITTCMSLPTPSSTRTVRRSIGPGPVDPQENFLSKIFSQCGVAKHVGKQSHQPVLITQNQLSEGCFVSLFHAQHQLHIRVAEVLI
jgi:hypothetical protein